MKPDRRNRGQKLIGGETEFLQKENGSIGNTNQKRKDGCANTIRILTEGEGVQGSIPPKGPIQPMG